MSEQPPRPPRSLRDRAEARNVENSALPPSDYIEKKPVEKPEDYSTGEDYLSQIDEIDDSNIVITDDMEDDPIPEQTSNKPKVQVLNVRENRKEKKQSIKTSTEEIKKEAKKEVSEKINKVKNEFAEIEVAFEDTKEEINKIKDKVAEETQVVKAKVIALGLQSLEKILSAPKNILMGLVFKKKKRPVEKKLSVNENKKESSKPTKKQIPKVKYADLLAQNIDFLTYDKRRFVEAYDTGTILEEIFLSNVISDIKYCVRFVGDLPSPTQGDYAHRKITEIFESSTPEDINRFLYYVTLNPETFKRNRFKFSEAYATWLIRKSHEL